MKNNFPKIPLFLSITFLIFSVFIFLFFYRTIRSNNDKMEASSVEWQREAQRRDEIRKLNNSVKVIENERIELETHFTKSSNIVPFLDTVEKMALSVGALAEVTSVNILEDATGLVVGIKLGGNFTSLYKFINLLENSDYLLEFISAEIKREDVQDASSKNGKVAKWQATFNIKLLSFVK